MNNLSLLANLAVAASSTHLRRSMTSGARVLASLELGSKAMVAKMRVMVKKVLEKYCAIWRAGVHVYKRSATTRV